MCAINTTIADRAIEYVRHKNFRTLLKPLPAPPRPPSMSGASVRSSSYENVSLEWRQYVKSTLKQYVSASGQGAASVNRLHIFLMRTVSVDP